MPAAESPPTQVDNLLEGDRDEIVAILKQRVERKLCWLVRTQNTREQEGKGKGKGKKGKWKR